MSETAQVVNILINDFLPKVVLTYLLPFIILGIAVRFMKKLEN